jgi:hypothetical protein
MTSVVIDGIEYIPKPEPVVEPQPEEPIYLKLKPGDRFIDDAEAESIFIGERSGNYAYWYQYGGDKYNVNSIRSEDNLIQWSDHRPAPVKPLHERVTIGCRVKVIETGEIYGVRSINGNSLFATLCAVQEATSPKVCEVSFSILNTNYELADGAHNVT